MTERDELIRELDRLRAEANARRDELRQIAADLPAAMSRRALLRALVGDVRRAPNKGEIVKRGLAKLGRAPRRALRRISRPRAEA